MEATIHKFRQWLAIIPSPTQSKAPQNVLVLDIVVYLNANYLQVHKGRNNKLIGTVTPQTLGNACSVLRSYLTALSRRGPYLLCMRKGNPISFPCVQHFLACYTPYIH